MRGVLSVLAVAAAVVAADGKAQGQTWSVVGARTVAPGANAIEVAAGWPSLSATYYRGLAPGFNLGGRVAFAYGVEGLVTAVAPGMKVQAVAKWRFFDSQQVSLAGTFEPGFIWHSTGPASSVLAFALPFGIKLGIAPAAAVALAITFDVPLWIQFGPGGGINVPLLTGVGVEYFISSPFLVFFRTRMGPTIRPSGLAQFTFEGLLGIGYRF